MTSRQSRLPEEGRRQIQEDYQRLEKEVASAQDKKIDTQQQVDEECRTISGISPENGVEQVEQTSEGLSKYTYKGKVASIDEVNLSGCSYTKVFFTDEGSFSVLVPSTMAAETDLGPMYFDIYNKYIGKDVEFFIVYEQQGTNRYYLEAWMPEIFYAN
jgi:hypothetical protein